MQNRKHSLNTKMDQDTRSLRSLFTLKNKRGQALTESTAVLVTLIGVFVSLIVGFILMSPVFTELSTAYTSVYVNNTTANFHSNQPFISLIGLGYILAVVFVPLVLLGIMAMKANKSGMFDLSETISKLVVILILIFVSVIVYLILLPLANGAYVNISAYKWASNYLTLITLAPLLFILGVAVIALFEGVSLMKEFTAS